MQAAILSARVEIGNEVGLLFRDAMFREQFVGSN